MIRVGKIVVNLRGRIAWTGRGWMRDVLGCGKIKQIDVIPDVDGSSSGGFPSRM